MTKDEFYQAAIQELQDIEKAQATVELAAGDILLGRVEYRTSHGWKIVVFSDGDDWDYIESMVPPSGEHFTLWPKKEEDDCEPMRKLRSYHPPNDQLGSLWGFLT